MAFSQLARRRGHDQSTMRLGVTEEVLRLLLEGEPRLGICGVRPSV